MVSSCGLLRSLKGKEVGGGGDSNLNETLENEMTPGSVFLTDMAQDQGHVQLPRADAIRSRLVDTFSLIEHLQGLSQAVPRHTVREILG